MLLFSQQPEQVLPAYPDPVWVAHARLRGGSPFGTSELATFSRCPQAHAFRYDLGLRPAHLPRSAENRETGVLVHIGLAHHYAARTPGFSRFDPKDPFVAMREAADIASYGYLYERSADTLRAYVAHYADGDLFDPVDVEAPCETTFTDATGAAHTLTTLIDLVARYRPTGRLVAVNHKTSVRLLNAVPSIAHRTSLQQLCELALSRARWGDVSVVMINPCQLRVKSAPVVGEPQVVPLSAVSYRRLWHDVSAIKRGIVQSREGWPNPFLRPRSYQCQSRYGRCEYHPVCDAGPVEVARYTSDKYTMESVVALAMGTAQ